MVTVKEMATIFVGGLALVTSFYGFAYFAIPSIYFPSKDCIMTYPPNPLFILPMLHSFRFIAYLYFFFTKGNSEYLNRIITVITYIITITILLFVYLFYIVPSIQPPHLSHSPPWFEASIISPAVTGCLKNNDICANLANSRDFFATFHRPILHACCVRRSVPRRYELVWDLAMQDPDQLNGTETGYVAFGCMAAYGKSIRKPSELDAWAIIAFETIVNLIFFLMPVKRGTRVVIAR